MFVSDCCCFSHCCAVSTQGPALVVSMLERKAGWKQSRTAKKAFTMIYHKWYNSDITVFHWSPEVNVYINKNHTKHLTHWVVFAFKASVVLFCIFILFSLFFLNTF